MTDTPTPKPKMERYTFKDFDRQFPDEKRDVIIRRAPGEVEPF